MYSLKQVLSIFLALLASNMKNHFPLYFGNLSICFTGSLCFGYAFPLTLIRQVLLLCANNETKFVNFLIAFVIMFFLVNRSPA